jgi:hypothetical protein
MVRDIELFERKNCVDQCMLDFEDGVRSRESLLILKLLLRTDMENGMARREQRRKL